MTPRHRAQQRLTRHVPVLRENAEREPARRVSARELDLTPRRPAPGDSVKVALQVRIKALRPAKVGPNAPLLIRLVRHPYALRAGRVVKRVEEARQRPSTLGREPFPSATREHARLRLEYRFAPPMRALAHAPEPRPRPFHRARSVAEEAELVFDPEPAWPAPEPVHFDPAAEEDWI